MINKKSKVIISIFAGRAADAGKDQVPEFVESINLSKKFRNVEILWASVRNHITIYKQNNLAVTLLQYHLQ